MKHHPIWWNHPPLFFHNKARLLSWWHFFKKTREKFIFLLFTDDPKFYQAPVSRFLVCRSHSNVLELCMIFPPLRSLWQSEHFKMHIEDLMSNIHNVASEFDTSLLHVNAIFKAGPKMWPSLTISNHLKHISTQLLCTDLLVQKALVSPPLLHHWYCKNLREVWVKCVQGTY